MNFPFGHGQMKNSVEYNKTMFNVNCIYTPDTNTLPKPDLDSLQLGITHLTHSRDWNR